MQARFFKNLLLVVVINLIFKPFYIFGIDRNVQILLGPAEYGLFFSLLMFSQIFTIILDPGISQFNNREISQNHRLIHQYFSNLAILKGILGLLFFGVMLGLAWLLNYSSLQIHLLIIILVNQFLLSFISFLRSNVSGLQLYVADSILSVTDRVILIALCSVLIWGNTSLALSSFSYALSMTISYFVTMVICILIIVRFSGRLSLSLDFSGIRELIRKFKPFAILIFLMAAYKCFDSFALERMLGGDEGKYQAGIYAQSYRIMDAFNQFALLFAGLLLPMFARLLKHKEPIHQLLNMSMMLLGIPAIILATACIAYREPLISLLYQQDAAGSSTIFGLLMISFLGMCFTYTYGTLLTAHGKLAQLNRMALVALILNIGLNLALIPSEKAIGSAFASALTQLFMSIVQVVLVVRYFDQGYRRKELTRIAAFVLVMSGMAFAFPYFADGAAGFIALLIAGGILAIGVRVFTPRALVSLLRSDKNQTE